MTHRMGPKTFALVVLCGLVGTVSASAQSRVYAGGAIVADIREVGDVNQEGSFVGDFSSRDATGVGGSFRVGTWLHPRWTLELGLDIATRTTTERESDFIIAIFPPPPPLNFKASSDFTTVTAMVGFHQPISARVQLGYRAGFAFVRSTSTLEVGIPGFPRILAQPAGVLSTTNSSSSLDLQAPAVSQTTNSGAAALGMEAAIALTPRLSIVPELRALVVNAPSNVFLIRPAAGVRWSF